MVKPRIENNIKQVYLIAYGNVKLNETIGFNLYI